MSFLRTASLAVVSACALALAGCPSPPPGGDGGTDAGSGPDSGPALDGGTDAGPSVDSGSDSGSELDSGSDSGAPPDSGPTCMCPPPEEPCRVPSCMGETCVFLVAPDGTACGPARSCVGGTCVHMPACGDGHREPAGPDREGCDDGNLELGDACDESCAPTVLLVASRTGQEDRPAGGAAAVAADDAGGLLFTWVSIDGTTVEPTHRVLAARFTAAGVRVGTDIELEAGIPLGEPTRPTVAGLGTGWVVVWRSPFAEGASADLGGIAHRLVRTDGTLGPRRAANQTTRLDQLDPRVARVEDGYAVVWTDTASRAGDAGLGVRYRVFDRLGGARTDELVLATTTSGTQSMPAIASSGTRWVATWADASAGAGTSVVRMRRFDGITALDASDLLVSSRTAGTPSVARGASSTVIAFTDRELELRGTIAVVEVADGATPDPAATPTLLMGETMMGAPPTVDDRPAIAGHPEGGWAVVWETASSPVGARLALAMGVTSVPELPDLAGALVSGRQSQVGIAATSRGLWVTWSDDAVSDARRAFAAYLLPWE